VTAPGDPVLGVKFPGATRPWEQLGWRSSFWISIVSKAGYEVFGASDGPEALRTVEEQVPFELFVIDIMMPTMRGDELGGRLRQRDADAKLLYFTGYIDRLFADRETPWEHEAFVDRPLSVKGLLEAVSLILFGDTRGPAAGRSSAA
jgi:CheY-like chemotaxis protein